MIASQSDIVDINVVSVNHGGTIILGRHSYYFMPRISADRKQTIRALSSTIKV